MTTAGGIIRNDNRAAKKIGPIASGIRYWNGAIVQSSILGAKFVGDG